MDAKSYAAGDKAGREGKAADSNPHSGTGTLGTLLEVVVAGPFAALIHDGGDKDKADSWAAGHNSGSHNKR